MGLDASEIVKTVKQNGGHCMITALCASCQSQCASRSIHSEQQGVVCVTFYDDVQSSERVDLRSVGIQMEYIALRIVLPVIISPVPM
jgi:hypothetical protein